MVFLETEIKRDHRHIFQGVGQGLRLIPLHITEEITNDFFGQTQYSSKPREHIIQYGPYQEREKYPEYPLLIKYPQRLFTDRQQQKSRHHDKDRHGRAEQRAIHGCPEFVLRNSPKRWRDIKRIDTMYPDNHQHSYRTYDV